MVEFGVSRHTVRAAMQALVSDGIVQRAAGRGSFVTDHVRGRQDWTIQTLEDLIADHFENNNRVLDQRFTEAINQAEAMAQLQLNHTEEIFVIRTLRMKDEQAYAFARIFLPGKVGKQLELEDLAARPIIQLIEDVCRLPAFRTRQVASAQLADAETSDLLGLPSGAPVLELKRTYFTREGLPIEHAQIYYRPDRYAQRIDLFRRTIPEL